MVSPRFYVEKNTATRAFIISVVLACCWVMSLLPQAGQQSNQLNPDIKTSLAGIVVRFHLQEGQVNVLGDGGIGMRCPVNIGVRALCEIDATDCVAYTWH